MAAALSEDKIVVKARDALAKANSLFPEIEAKTDCQLVSFICHQSIMQRVAYRLNKIIRRCSNSKKLAVLVDSSGGDVDATAKIVKTLRNQCEKYITIVPFWAKSAASLLVASADEIIMCKSGELGPIDPMVRDPQTGMWIPASSIKEALNLIQATEDPLVKLSMADKLPPLLMGAYRTAQQISRQYVEEAFEKLGDKKKEAIAVFTEKYISHGYPIDRNLCKHLGLPVTFPDNDLETKIYDLQETYIDLLIGLEHRPEEEEEMEQDKMQENLIIQTKSEKCVIIHGIDVSGLI